MEDAIKREREYLRIGVQEAFLCSEFVIKYLEKGKRDENLKINEELVKNYCMLDQNLKIRPDIIQRFKAEEERRITHQENAEPTAEENKRDYSKEVSEKVNKESKKSNPTQHDKFKLYQKKVSRLVKKADGEEDGDDLTVTDETNNLIDPLSKNQLVDPVITVRCQHRFSRKHIMQQLQEKYSLQCPYVGCKEKFGVDDLEEDVITSQTLQRIKLQAQV